jgi:glutamate formiminotransferase / formiminotetrahydrofolate cyclodeaminase
MAQIVECIANFSAAREAAVVDQIVGAISEVPGIHLLGHESDMDHNRSVVTFVGDAVSIVEGAFAGIASAAASIDLDQHTGAHPRLGAADVIPFVPIQDITMEECVGLARQLGERVGSELNLPVYLYEYAATRPDRRNLADVRRGEYETLKEAIATDPARTPDYGPKQLGKAGAVIIGARDPLIAYNVYLNTADVAIAQRIARVVRHSSGGLHSVKAMGVLVDGQAQVSMNLTNYRKTSLHHALEMIRREAARYGVSVSRSEIIGLVPQQALLDAARWYCQLDDVDDNQILEKQISELAQPEQPIAERLAAATPTPGGGSAAAYSGAMAAGLVGMVAALTIDKPKYAPVRDEMLRIREQSESLRGQLEHLVQEDANAFDAVMAAYRLPKADPAEQALRESAIGEATRLATQVPLQTAGLARDVLRLAVDVADRGNANAVTDAGTAGNLASAAIASAALNVRINSQGMGEAGFPFVAELAAIEGECRQLLATMKETVARRANITVI